MANLKHLAILGLAAVLFAFGAAGILDRAQTDADADAELEPETPAFYAAWGIDPDDLPYSAAADARADLAAARQRAAAAGKILMVSFGANWCPDCLTLHKNMHQDDTREYVQAALEVVNVDVGQFDRNLEVAKELGVTVQGIPLAVFFLPNGQPIGSTSGGELEPSRNYTSAQILKFLHEVVDHHRIVTPQ